MDIRLLLVSAVLFSGCATVDKALAPVDEGVNSTKTVFQRVGHSVSETASDIGDSASGLKAGLMESSLMKVFLSDRSVQQNREKNYINWTNASGYRLNDILQKAIAGSEIKNPQMLKTAQKMQILKEYFFNLKKEEHAKAFAAKHKKPVFNEFLTDRENIEKIHEYKTALLDSEHQWRLDLKQTQKRVAELMLSTLYAAPLVEYVSYDPYEEELFLSVKAAHGGFKEKIKIKAEKTLAQNMKTHLSKVKPYVFFEFNDDVLGFVGISIKYENKSYIAEVVDTAYVRQSDVVFTSGDISLESLNVQYYDIVKNVKPPQWFNNLKAEKNTTIGYGEGISKDDAKKEAYKEIAMSIQTTVSTTIESEKVVTGSTVASSTKSNTEQKVEEISIEGSKVLKVEKKDGLWFVAVLYDK